MTEGFCGFFEHVSNALLDVIWDLWTTKDGFES
jgi:hypothetical protein